MKLSKIILWIALGGLAALVALFAMFMIGFMRVFGASVEVGFVWCITITVAAVVAFGCAVVLEKGHAPGWMRSGLWASGIAAIGWGICTVVADNQTYFTWQRVLTWPSTWAALMMVIGLVLLPERHERGWRVLRTASIVLLCFFAAHICLATAFHPGFDIPWEDQAAWREVRHYEDVVYRIGTLLLLLAATAVVILFITAGWQALHQGQSWQPAGEPYEVHCPRCGDQQQLTTGIRRCRQCQLQIEVRVR